MARVSAAAVAATAAGGRGTRAARPVARASRLYAGASGAARPRQTSADPSSRDSRRGFQTGDAAGCQRARQGVPGPTGHVRTSHSVMK